MSQLIYLDTNIYIDYFEGRVDNLRPLGEFAFNVVRKAIGCEFRIMISPLVIKEVAYNNHEKELIDLMNLLKEKNKLIVVKIKLEDKIKTERLFRLYKSDYNDLLHFVIAKQNNVELFVTRNIKDFPSIDEFPEVVFPENL